MMMKKVMGKFTNTAAVGSITMCISSKTGLLCWAALAAACSYSPVDAFTAAAPKALARPRWSSRATISRPPRGMFMVDRSSLVQENSLVEAANELVEAAATTTFEDAELQFLGIEEQGVRWNIDGVINNVGEAANDLMEAATTTVEDAELQFLAMEEQGVRWNMDSVLNKALLVGVAALVFAKVSMIDADLSRGWSAAEVARHLPMSVWQSYMKVLTDSPIATKAVTSATVYTIGDVIAQTTDGTSIDDLDRMRSLRSMLAGLIGHGPLSHVWYNVSENLFTNVLHLTAWWSFIPKVGVDQFFWGPIWNNTYLLLLGLMKGDSIENIWGDVKRTTVPLVLSGLKLWPFAHCITYGLMPVENRLLWVDLVEIAWVVILASSAAQVSHQTSDTDIAVDFAKGDEVDEEPAFVNR